MSRGHPDFSTKHQQDAQEYFLHFITTLQVGTVQYIVHRLSQFDIFIEI